MRSRFIRCLIAGISNEIQDVGVPMTLMFTEGSRALGRIPDGTMLKQQGTKLTRAGLRLDGKMGEVGGAGVGAVALMMRMLRIRGTSEGGFELRTSAHVQSPRMTINAHVGTLEEITVHFDAET